MEYIVLIVCILFFLIGFVLEKDKINALTVFAGLWGMIAFLASLELFDLKSASDNTYIIFAIGISSFCIGYLYFRIFFTRSKTFADEQEKSCNLRKRIIYILFFITILLYLKDLFIVIKHITENNQSLAYIRALAQDKNSELYTSRSGLESCIRMLFLQPFVLAIQPILAVEFIDNRKKSKTLFILNIAILFLRTITDGSRVIFIYFVMHIVLAYIYINKSKNKTVVFQKNRKVSKILIFFILTIGLIALYKTSVARSGSNTLKNVYYYYSMEPTMFEIWQEVVDSKDVYGYGRASLNGYIFPAIYTIKNTFGIDSYPKEWYNNIFLLINDTDLIWQVIAKDNIKANAYVSIFFFLYLDGRYLGVVIGNIIYGAFLAYFYSKYSKNKNHKNLVCLLFLLQGLLFSYVRMQFSNETYALALIYIWILYNSSNANKKEKNESR